MTRVLIIEDNEDIMEILKKKMLTSGYLVESMRSGLEAVSLLRDKKATPPDIVILDWVLPDRNGQEILNTIKSVWPFCRLFIFSAHEEYKTQIPQGVVEGFFCKSDGIASLLEAFKK